MRTAHSLESGESWARPPSRASPVHPGHRARDPPSRSARLAARAPSHQPRSATPGTRPEARPRELAGPASLFGPPRSSTPHSLRENVQPGPQQVQTVPELTELRLFCLRLPLAASLPAAGRAAYGLSSMKLDPLADGAERAHGAHQTALWQRAHAFWRDFRRGVGHGDMAQTFSASEGPWSRQPDDLANSTQVSGS